MWHIDGNHSLSRWGFYIHGGIDGYSYVITFLKCSLSNSAENVANSFIAACPQIGVPSRIRNDFGGEISL